MESSPQMMFANVPGAPGVPQVNLLPPHITAKRKSAVTRRWMWLGVAVVLLLVALVAVWAKFEQVSAENDLVEIQDQNQALVDQQADYAEVTSVLHDLKQRTEARDLAMSTEILWSPYLAALASATPGEITIQQVSVSQGTIWASSSSGSSGPLTTVESIGGVSVNGRAETIPDTSTWEEQLSALPGISDVEVSSVEAADEDGELYYAVAAVFNLNADAFANQFVEDDAADAADADASDTTETEE